MRLCACAAKKPARFTVDATGAGQAPLEVTYADKFGHKKAADIRTHGDGTFDVIYYPESDGLLAFGALLHAFAKYEHDILYIDTPRTYELPVKHLKKVYMLYAYIVGCRSSN